MIDGNWFRWQFQHLIIMLKFFTIQEETILGSKDNLYRNIVSTLSNFHFVGNSIHKKRLEYIGIPQKNISVVGEPSISNKIYKQTQKKYILATLYPSDFEKINYLKQIKLF